MTLNDVFIKCIVGVQPAILSSYKPSVGHKNFFLEYSRARVIALGQTEEFHMSIESVDITIDKNPKDIDETIIKELLENSARYQHILGSSESLYTEILDIGNKIYRNINRGVANTIVTSKKISSLLQQDFLDQLLAPKGASLHLIRA